MALEHYAPPRDPWIDIVYQDDDILVVNKPAGLLSVPGRLPEHYDSLSPSRGFFRYSGGASLGYVDIGFDAAR